VKKERRTQAERRAATRAAVVESACRLFGRKGFAETSLDEIASAAGVTIGPIYHYFGSKLALFEAVNEIMEERIIDSLQKSDGGAMDAWRLFLVLCEDTEFRRIVLVDGPNILGRDRWATSPVMRTVTARSGDANDVSEENGPSHLALRILVGALTQAALAIAESDDPTETSAEAETTVSAILSALALRRRPDESGAPRSRG
jgi:AcrR family transcriptional regulator